MNKIDYNKFRERLSKNQKNLLDEVYERYFTENKQKISEGVRTNTDHLKLINFCSTFFQVSSRMDLDYGYRLFTIEPLYGTGLKNFDLGIYNQNEKCLILIECKTSISDINEELKDMEQAINQTIKNKELLEKFLGIEIVRLEFVICTDGNIARDLCEKILEKNLPIITWASSQTRNELKIFESFKEEHGNAIKNFRVHYDEQFNKALFNGIKILGTQMLYPIIPSSNLCIILTHLNLTIKAMQEKGDLNEDISCGDLFHILKKELLYSTLDDDNINNLVEICITKGISKEIFSDEMTQEKEIKRKKIKIKISKQTAEKLKRHTIDNYINKNAENKAHENAIEDLKNKGIIKSLNDFFK